MNKIIFKYTIYFISLHIIFCCISCNTSQNNDICFEKFEYQKICRKIDNEIDSINQTLKKINNTDSKLLLEFIQDTLRTQLISHHFDQTSLYEPIEANYCELLYIESIQFFNYDNGRKERNYESFLYLNDGNNKIMHYYPGDYEYLKELRNPKICLDRSLYRRLKKSIKTIFADNYDLKREINPAFINYFEGNLKSFVAITKIDNKENFCRILFNPSAIEIQNKFENNCNNNINQITQINNHIDNILIRYLRPTYDWPLTKNTEDSLNIINNNN